MKLEIRFARNGFILNDSIDPEGKKTYIFEDDNMGESIEAFANLLSKIDELIGPTTTRHDAKRVYIKVEPGDKFGDGEEEEKND